VVMAIASNAVPAAITHVDARTESEFTSTRTIVINTEGGAKQGIRRFV